MAHMIPAQPKEFTAASQEGAVFEALSLLPDDFYVLHSMTVAALNASNAYTVHECDFVVIHPAKGILVIEAKSGRGIQYRDRNWYYSNGKLMPHNGPYCQANTAMHTLMDRVDRIAPPHPQKLQVSLHRVVHRHSLRRAADPGPAVGEPAPHHADPG